MAEGPHLHRQVAGRRRFEIADIFRRSGPLYARSKALTSRQRRVLSAVTVCRTAALGGHMDECDRCGHAKPSYNSCRDRHCPTCQSLQQAKGIEARNERIVNSHYFHLVFTLPGELRALVRYNPKLLYGLLFKAVSKTLLALGQEHLGGLIGLSAVMHTWDRKMLQNLHAEYLAL